MAEQKKAKIGKEYPISMLVYLILHTLYQVHSKRQAVSIIILLYNIHYGPLQGLHVCHILQCYHV